MTQSNRKLLGVVLFLLSIAVWAVGITALYDAFLQGLPGWLLILFFCAAGLTWGLPAATLIRWMSKPD